MQTDTNSLLISWRDNEITRSWKHAHVHTQMYTQVLLGKAYPGPPVKNTGYPADLLYRGLIILEEGRSIGAPDGV